MALLRDRAEGCASPWKPCQAEPSRATATLLWILLTVYLFLFRELHGYIRLKLRYKIVRGEWKEVEWEGLESENGVVEVVDRVCVKG